MVKDGSGWGAMAGINAAYLAKSNFTGSPAILVEDKNLSNIWIVNFDGSDMRPITTGNHNASSPKWSNNGKMFTFRSNHDGTTQLYLYNLENNSTQKLTNF